MTQIISFTRTPFFFGFVILFVIVSSKSSRADVKSEAVEQLWKQVSRQFSKEIVEDGTELAFSRFARFVSQYGDDGVNAIRRVGPSAISVAHAADEFAPEAIRLLATHGESALFVATDRQVMSALRQYGDDFGAVLVRNGRPAIAVAQEFGAEGASCLMQVSRQNGRRLCMMLSDGTVEKIGGRTEICNVVQKFGDKAMNFIWDNKGALAVTTVAATFWANPEPFINGSVQLGKDSASLLIPDAVAAANSNQIARWCKVAVCALAITCVVLSRFGRRCVYRTLVFALRIGRRLLAAFFNLLCSIFERKTTP